MDISRKELGLLAGALRRAEDWEVSYAACCNVIGRNGKVSAENRQAIRAAMRLAKHYRHLLNKVRNELGKP